MEEVNTFSSKVLFSYGGQSLLTGFLTGQWNSLHFHSSWWTALFKIMFSPMVPDIGKYTNSEPGCTGNHLDKSPEETVPILTSLGHWVLKNILITTNWWFQENQDIGAYTGIATARICNIFFKVIDFKFTRYLNWFFNFLYRLPRRKCLSLSFWQLVLPYSCITSELNRFFR